MNLLLSLAQMGEVRMTSELPGAHNCANSASVSCLYSVRKKPHAHSHTSKIKYIS